MSSRAYLASIVLLTACAGGPPPGEPVPLEATWTFSGQVEAYNQFRTGPQRVVESVSGTVEIQPDVVHLTSTHGGCSQDRSRAITGRGLVVSCDRIRVRLGPGNGEVTVRVKTVAESRGRCVAYDQQRRCTEYSWSQRTIDRNVTGSVVVTGSEPGG